MKAKEVLGEFGDSLFSLLEIDPLVYANFALNKCNEYLKKMGGHAFTNCDTVVLEQLEKDIKLVITSKVLLEKALLEEDKKRNDIIARITNLLSTQD